jgi:hypothetical protein
MSFSLTGAESVWLPMVALLVVLAQKIFAVVVAVWGAHDYMDVIFVRLFVLPERNAPLMVELNDDDRTLDAIVKHTVVIHAAHPAKVGIPQMALHFLHSYLGMIRPHPSDMQLNQTQQQIVLRT